MEKLLVTDMAGQAFTWRKGKYIEKGGYLIPSGRAYEYRPDFERICEVLAGLTEEEIPWFANEFGLPGTWAYFLKTGAYESYVRFEKPQEKPARLKWDRLFGLIEGCTLTFDYKDSNDFWRAYREPVLLTELALAEFRHAVRAALAGEFHHALKVQFELVEGQLICRASSLLEGALATFLWNITHGKVFRECAGRGRYGCMSCKHGRMYFWPKSKKHVMGETACKIYQAGRARKHREGKTEKMPQRSKIRMEQAIAMHRQGVSTVEIAERLGVSMGIVVNWVKGEKKGKDKKRVRRLLNNSE
ncbi:MAG: hypothetical protein K6U04_05620 [Armatimonadetes bacterium]|nr:hypothetical protein [Armatimonadota bacterium]